MRYDPIARTLTAKHVELPNNDPIDAPIGLAEIVSSLRRTIAGAEELKATDMKYIGCRDMMFGLKGVALGGPWKGWWWRLDHKGLSYFVLVIEEELAWICWQAIRPGEEEQVMKELAHRAVLRRDRPRLS